MKHRKSSLLFLGILIFSQTKPTTILIFGGKTGWIGQKIVKVFTNAGYDTICAQSRLENRQSIEKEIESIMPDAIINAAGITGRPNVNWCETHQQETIRANVLGLLNLADIAYLHNIHLINIGTGCIYEYDEDHPLDSGIGFTEDETPNFAGSFYSHTKIISEEVLKSYPNVLYLRLRMPISKDFSPRSFIGKIIQYKKLINIPNSMSVLEDLLPLIPKMVEKKLTGIYNFVNPGAISHNQIANLYIKHVNPNHHYENFSIEEQNRMLKVPRSNCELSAKKLMKHFPGIPHIQDSVSKLFQNKL